jgi:hypothetical protein
MDCEFIDCNLSMTSLMGTSLKRFILVIVNYGIQFNSCTDFLFAVSFQDCVLDYSSFANENAKDKFQFLFHERSQFYRNYSF